MSEIYYSKIYLFNFSSSDASEESNEDKPTPDEPLQKTEAEKPEVDCDSDSGKINTCTVKLFISCGN